MSIDVTQPRTAPTLSERAAEEIRVLLARRRMSQAELARQMAVSGAWLNYRLTGKQPIDLNDLEMIAVVLGVTPSELLGASSSPTRGYGATTRRRPSTKRIDAGHTADKPRAARPPSYPHAGRRPQLLIGRSGR